MRKLNTRKFLKTTCKEVLEDLYETINFDDLEKFLFKELYLKRFTDKRDKICQKIGYEKTAYSQIHNNLLSKVEAYISFISK